MKREGGPGVKPEMNESVVAGMQHELAQLRQTIASMVENSEGMTAIVIALLAQYGDPTHVTVARAAHLRGCSVKTIRRAIEAGELTLEVIPGTRLSGIPVEQIYSRWLPIQAARRAIEKAQSERQQLSIGAFSRRSGVHSRNTKAR